MGMQKLRAFTSNSPVARLVKAALPNAAIRFSIALDQCTRRPPFGASALQLLF